MFAVVALVAMIGQLAARAEGIEGVESEVRINELTWAGSSYSGLDEWIELYNPGAPTDIGGWQITKDTGGGSLDTESPMVTIPIGTMLGAGEYWVVSRYGAERSVQSLEPSIPPDSAITLSNTALHIRLYAGDWMVKENLVDTAGTGGAPPAGDNLLKLSMERDADGEGWHSAVGRANLDPGTPEAPLIDMATPGAENSVPTISPVLTSIAPTTATANQAWVATLIVGENLEIAEGNEVILRCGELEVVASSFDHPDTTQIINAAFDLTNAVPGWCDVEWREADGDTATLIQAVEVVAAPPPPPPVEEWSSSVRINEVYPEPDTGSNDEFIELVNLSEEPVSLAGWQIDDVADEGSVPYTIVDILLPAHGFATIYKPQSKITLNDDGDTARLIRPDGMELDSTTYPEAKRGQSWARQGNSWQWTTTPTAQAANIFNQASDEDEDDEEEFEVFDIVINELMPNPATGEEWIELYNTENRAARIDGWRIEDASGRGYAFKSNSQIGAKGYLILKAVLSKIALNNIGGETVVLLAPDGREVDTVEYPDKAPEDASYSRDPDGEWWWTTPATPGKANVIMVSEVEAWPGNVVADDEDEAMVLADTLPQTGPGRLSGPMLGWLSALLGIIWWLRRKLHEYC